MLFQVARFRYPILAVHKHPKVELPGLNYSVLEHLSISLTVRYSKIYTK